MFGRVTSQMSSASFLLKKQYIVRVYLLKSILL